MNRLSIYTIFVLTFVLFTIGLYYFIEILPELKKPSKTETIVIHDTVPKIDTIIRIAEGPTKIKYVEIHTNDTFYQNVDTMAIVKDYLMVVYGTHILRDDSIAFEKFNYAISRNRLLYTDSATLIYRLPTQVTNNIYNYNRGLFLGGYFNPNSYGVDLTYINKKMLFRGFYDVRLKVAGIGIGYKIYNLK